MSIELTDYQERTKVTKKKRIIMHWPMGSGKTFGALTYLKHHPGTLPALIVSPKAVFPHWREQAEQLLELPKDEIMLISGLPKKRREMLTKPAALYIVNPDQIRLHTKQLRTMAEEGHIRSVIIDELTGWRRPSQRTKALKSIVKHLPVRLGLTGGLITEKWDDIYNPTALIHDDRYFPKSFFEFHNKYFNEPKDGEHKWQVTDFGRRQIRALFEAGCDIVLPDEVDLPEVSYQKRYFNPTHEQNKALSQLKKDWRLDIIGEDYQYIGQKIQKALQIMSGFIIQKDKPEPHFFKVNPRLQCLMQTVEEFGKEPFVIYISYKCEKQYITKALEDAGYKVESQWENFNPGNADAFVGTYSKHSKGIELQRATHLIHYRRSWTYDQYNQASHRIIRKGSKTGFAHIVSITSNTMPDRLIDKIIREKTEIVNYLARQVDLKSLWSV